MQVFVPRSGIGKVRQTRRNSFRYITFHPTGKITELFPQVKSLTYENVITGPLVAITRADEQRFGETGTFNKRSAYDFFAASVQSLLGHQLLLGLSCFTSSNYEDETLGALERR